jgi:hypothetical protein
MNNKKLINSIKEKIKKGRPCRRDLSEEYLTPEAAEREIGIPKKSLANLRHLRRGPDYLKVGARVFYIRKDLHEYMKSKKVRI